MDLQAHLSFLANHPFSVVFWSSLIEAAGVPFPSRVILILTPAFLATETDLVRRVEWDTDHSRAKLEGVGFSVEMWVDAQAVHATGDVPFLGGLLGSSLAAGLKQIMQLTFRNKLP